MVSTVLIRIWPIFVAILLGAASIPALAVDFYIPLQDDETFDNPDSEDDLSYYYQEHEQLGNRFISPILSLIVPGAGQIYNQQFGKGFFHAGLFFGFASAKRHYASAVTDDERYTYRQHLVEQETEAGVYLNYNKLSHSLFQSLQLNTAFYSAFDAYRIAALSQEDKPPGPVRVSRESLGDLTLAPFTAKYFFDPYVFVPLAATALYLIGSGSSNRDNDNLIHYRYSENLNRTTLALSGIVRHEFVAVGEETFFRGAVNTETTRYFGSFWGVIASAVVFGISHSGQGASAGPAVATGYGLYLGYLHLQKKGQLGYNIALHYWWNVAVNLSVIDRSREFTIPLASMEF